MGNSGAEWAQGGGVWGVVIKAEGVCSLVGTGLRRRESLVLVACSKPLKTETRTVVPVLTSAAPMPAPARFRQMLAQDCEA